MLVWKVAMWQEMWGACVASTVAMCLVLKRSCYLKRGIDVGGQQTTYRLLGLTWTCSCNTGDVTLSLGWLTADACSISALNIGTHGQEYRMTQDDTPIIWRGPMVNSAFDKMLLGTQWGRLDVLVVDLPPGEALPGLSGVVSKFLFAMRFKAGDTAVCHSIFSVDLPSC